MIARFRPVNERERAEMAEQENPVNFLNEQTVGALPQPAAQPRLVALAAGVVSGNVTRAARSDRG